MVTHDTYLKHTHTHTFGHFSGVKDVPNYFVFFFLDERVRVFDFRLSVTPTFRDPYRSLVLLK